MRGGWRKSMSRFRRVARARCSAWSTPPTRCRRISGSKRFATSLRGSPSPGPRSPTRRRAFAPVTRCSIRSGSRPRWSAARCSSLRRLLHRRRQPRRTATMPAAPAATRRQREVRERSASRLLCECDALCKRSEQPVPGARAWPRPHESPPRRCQIPVFTADPAHRYLRQIRLAAEVIVRSPTYALSICRSTTEHIGTGGSCRCSLRPGPLYHVEWWRSHL